METKLEETIKLIDEAFAGGYCTPVESVGLTIASALVAIAQEFKRYNDRMDEFVGDNEYGKAFRVQGTIDTYEQNR